MFGVWRLRIHGFLSVLVRLGSVSFRTAEAEECPKQALNSTIELVGQVLWQFRLSMAEAFL